MWIPYYFSWTALGLVINSRRAGPRLFRSLLHDLPPAHCQAHAAQSKIVGMNEAIETKAVPLLSAAAHIKVFSGSSDPNTNMCFFYIYNVK